MPYSQDITLKVAQTILGYDIIEGLDNIQTFKVTITPKKNTDGSVDAETVSFNISFSVKKDKLGNSPFNNDDKTSDINLIIEKDTQIYKLTGFTKPELALTPTFEHNDTTLRVNLSCRANYSLF